MSTILQRRTSVLMAALAALAAVSAVLAGCGSSSGGTSPSASPSSAAMTRQQVIDLVELTGASLGDDVQATLAAIDAGEAPYVDPANAEFYSYVSDMKLTVLAHPNSEIVGQNNVGKPDPAGRYYRDEILAGVTTKGSGWVEYVYVKPETEGWFLKESYYKVFTGADGKKYVVSAGRYLGPWTSPTPSSSPSA